MPKINQILKNLIKLKKHKDTRSCILPLLRPLPNTPRLAAETRPVAAPRAPRSAEEEDLAAGGGAASAARAADDARGGRRGAAPDAARRLRSGTRAVSAGEGRGAGSR